MTVPTLTASKVIVISGPTASGKSWLAERLAEEYPAVIINADSMQVYKDLPILSAQPDIRQAPNKYKLYGTLNFANTCSAGLWATWANAAIEEALTADKLPVVVGGSGLYLRALLEGIADIPQIDDSIKAETANQFDQLGAQAFHERLMVLDPALQDRIHVNDTYRMQRAMHVLKQTGHSIVNFADSSSGSGSISNSSASTRYNHLHVHINPPRDSLYQNCNNRFAQMLQAGALEEVRALAEKIKAASALAPFNIEKTLGYRQLLAHLADQSTLEDAIATTQQLTRNYAKRQCTWFNNQFPTKTTIACNSAKLDQTAEHLLRMVANFQPLNG